MSRAIDVTRRLQRQIDGFPGIAAINNDTMGMDSAYGIEKQFGALATVNGHDIPFACQEDRTIDFYRPGVVNPGQFIEEAKDIAR